MTEIPQLALRASAGGRVYVRAETPCWAMTLIIRVRHQVILGGWNSCNSGCLTDTAYKGTRLGMHVQVWMPLTAVLRSHGGTRAKLAALHAKQQVFDLCISYSSIHAPLHSGLRNSKSFSAHQGSKGMYSFPAAYSRPPTISSLVRYPLQFETVGTGGDGGGRLGVTLGCTAS